MQFAKGVVTVPDGKKRKSNPPKIVFEILTGKTTSVYHTTSTRVIGIMSNGSITQVFF